MNNIICLLSLSRKTTLKNTNSRRWCACAHPAQLCMRVSAFLLRPQPQSAWVRVQLCPGVLLPSRKRRRSIVFRVLYQQIKQNKTKNPPVRLQTSRRWSTRGDEFYYANPTFIWRPLSFAPCLCLLLPMHTHFTQFCFSILLHLPPEINVFAGDKTKLLDRVCITTKPVLHDQRKSCLFFQLAHQGSRASRRSHFPSLICDFLLQNWPAQQHIHRKLLWALRWYCCVARSLLPLLPPRNPPSCLLVDPATAWIPRQTLFFLYVDCHHLVACPRGGCRKNFQDCFPTLPVDVLALVAFFQLPMLFPTPAACCTS